MHNKDAMYMYTSQRLTRLSGTRLALGTQRHSVMKLWSVLKPRACLGFRSRVGCERANQLQGSRKSLEDANMAAEPIQQQKTDSLRSGCQ